MSYLDRVRAAALMEQARMDALLLFQPEAFKYATGLDAGVAAMWRRGGAAVALVPADPDVAAAAILSDHALHLGPAPRNAIEIVTHPIWIDYIDYSGSDDTGIVSGLTQAYRAQALGGARPETFDFIRVIGLIDELLESRNLRQARIGVDLEFLPAADFHALCAALPKVTFVDGSAVLRGLRCIKHPDEITHLRNASRASEAGLQHMASNAQLGMAHAELDHLWHEGVMRAAKELGVNVTGTRSGIAVGSDLVATNPVLRPGDLVKADMGVAVEGYLSDGTRSYIAGPPGEQMKHLYGIIEDAFYAGLGAIRPGAAFCEVHAAVLATTRKAGLQDYCRGHFGHSIGASHGSEEWPFISATNHAEIQPGMVLAFEVPFYLHGTGAIMIEDQLLVTPTGVEVMNTLPRELAIIGQN